MPNLPMRQCICGAIVSGDCPECTKKRKKQWQQEYDRNRPSASKRGYNASWQRLRKAKLRKNPLCECDDCQAGLKRVVAASLVHHIQSVESHPELRLKWDNLMSVSRKCHERIHGRF